MIQRGSCVHSFYCAIVGLKYGILSQRSMKIHIAMAALVFFFAWELGMDERDFIVLALTIGMVMTAEMMNTAIEAVVDLVSPDFHPLAKVAKDVAAGAVLVAAIAAAAVGFVLFYTRLFG